MPVIYAVGFDIRQGWYPCKLFSIKLYSKRLVTSCVYKNNWFLLDLHSQSQHVFIHKHSIKPFCKAALKYHIRCKWVVYMTGNLLHWYTDHTIGANWKPCFYHVLIFIKNRFNFLPMFLNILICYYEEKKLKLLIIVCRFESFLNIFFSQPPIFENIF